MHLVFVEKHGLEEGDVAVDLAQDPADINVLSFSDSDLTAFAAGWHKARNEGAELPSLRLANLNKLTHPLSVDVYLENTLSASRAILIRLIGGFAYWSYGLTQLRALAERHHIALAVLPADGRADPQLDEISTLPVSTLRRLSSLCETGGAHAAHAALAQLALAGGLYASPVRGVRPIGNVGCWHPDFGVSCPMLRYTEDGGHDRTSGRIAIICYRSFVTAADMAPMHSLYRCFQDRGYEINLYFLPSLKAPDAAAWLERQLTEYQPDAIVNMTAFSGRRGELPSVLDCADVPVFQIALSTASEQSWSESSRGLSAADMAMHIVLPEVDGRIFAGVASFKEQLEQDEQLQFSLLCHQPHAEQINAIADKIEGWINLGKTSAEERCPALILSSYPGKPWQIAHAVGLDGMASAQAILADQFGLKLSSAELAERLQTQTISWPVDAYEQALETIPHPLRQQLKEVWGDAGTDPHVYDNAFHFSAIRFDNIILAVQPERSETKYKKDAYHDLARTPPHQYVAFYLWLSHTTACDCIVHIGAHGTLEWLPGKSVALSQQCWPEVLSGHLPVIYPFIVNDPGEAAQAKRRIGAVTLGHVPPPLALAGSSEKFATIERMLDEFSNADGLDPKRRDRLALDIKSEAIAIGLDTDLGFDDSQCDADILQRIDSFVCDVKDSQFASGLHIFGREAPAAEQACDAEDALFDPAEIAAAEREGLADALAGRPVAPGPAGSPYRGRLDVLPTGRNLFAVDPLSVPTEAAYQQGIRLGDEFVRRYCQDNGDYPRQLVIDLWGSQSMRTAGEEFAMALHLIGVRPIYREKTARIDGFEILPVAMLERPRIEVTLRVSGLFRDIFGNLMSLFDQAVQALAERDEAADWNPYAGKSDTPAIFSPAPEQYGVNMDSALAAMTEQSRTEAAEAWLAASSWAYHKGRHYSDMDQIKAKVKAADAFVHLQDLKETDLLSQQDYAAHEAGFLAANSLLGGDVSAYHLDNSTPQAPVARSLGEEIARVVYARAANPQWIDSMKPHGFRGAAEIVSTLDHMAAFSHLSGLVGVHLFDQFFAHTLGDQDVAAFIETENPQAYQALCDKFHQLRESGLWNSRHNAHIATLAMLMDRNTPGEKIA